MMRVGMTLAARTRVLVVVGATHKPYFEAYLRLMHEIRITPVEQVLGK